METSHLKIQSKISHNMAEKKLLSAVMPGYLKISFPIKKTTEEIFPFFSLPLKNQAELVRIGKSFIADVERGQKSFGFSSLEEGSTEQHLLAFAGFLNFSLKAPVLMVVSSFKDSCWEQFKDNFTEGTLWKWKTHDWANLCIVDHEQINMHGDSFNSLDFNIITKEFGAILWSLPKSNVEKTFPKNTFSIMEKVNSITFLANKAESSITELKKSVFYYDCFGIKLKGVLTAGNEK